MDEATRARLEHIADTDYEGADLEDWAPFTVRQAQEVLTTIDALRAAYDVDHTLRAIAEAERAHYEALWVAACAERDQALHRAEAAERAGAALPDRRPPHQDEQQPEDPQQEPLAHRRTEAPDGPPEAP